MPTDKAAPPQRLLRVSAVADQLGVSRATVYRWAHAGTLPAVRVGYSIRIPSDELKQYVYGDPDTHGGVPLAHETRPDRTPSGFSPRAQKSPEESS